MEKNVKINLCVVDLCEKKYGKTNNEIPDARRRKMWINLMLNQKQF